MRAPAGPGMDVHEKGSMGSTFGSNREAGRQHDAFSRSSEERSLQRRHACPTDERVRGTPEKVLPENMHRHALCNALADGLLPK